MDHIESSSLLSSRSSSDKLQSLIGITAHYCSNSPSLENSMRKFWELEEAPRGSVLSIDNERCEEHFCSTHSRLADRHFVVCFPFKSGPPVNVRDSRTRAKKCLNCLSRWLLAKPEQLVEYEEFLREHERLGHMRKAPDFVDLILQPVYIPHHPVYRDNSSISHLRVVFNASNLTSNGSSLNDHLYEGLKLQADSSAIVLAWRDYLYGWYHENVSSNARRSSRCRLSADFVENSSVWADFGSTRKVRIIVCQRTSVSTCRFNTLR